MHIWTCSLTAQDQTALLRGTTSFNEASGDIISRVLAKALARYYDFDANPSRLIYAKLGLLQEAI
jgi:hypothetical protein